jgi:hypothetical protein
MNFITDWQFWGLSATIAGLIITIVKMWLSSSEKLAAHKQFVVTSLAVQEKMILDNQSKIDENRLNILRDMEQIKRDRADRVAAVYAEIEAIKKMRETDVKELTTALRDSIDKTTAIEERHHNEVIVKIEALTVQLTDMCSTFKEYRRTHNGGRRSNTENET